jgi:hypothetical protein
VQRINVVVQPSAKATPTGMSLQMLIIAGGTAGTHNLQLQYLLWTRTCRDHGTCRDIGSRDRRCGARRGSRNRRLVHPRRNIRTAICKYPVE